MYLKHEEKEVFDRDSFVILCMDEDNEEKR